MSKFNHVFDIGQRDVVSSLEDNIKSFLDWSFLNIGGFVNVNLPTGNPLPPGNHQLSAVSGDPTVVYPKTWAAPKKDWIYETGINYNNNMPISISGVNLNGTFLPGPSGSGAYGYNIDYPRGRITFTNNIAANSKVALAYSYRFIQTYKASDNAIWREIEENNYNLSTVVKNPNYVFNSIQLPSIFLQTIARSISVPRELGTTQNILRQDILLHVFTENSIHRNNIVDILLKQKDNSLNLYDINKLAKNNRQFLNYRGEANPNRLNYDQISLDNHYLLARAYIIDAITSEFKSFSQQLHHAVVRWTVEIFP